MSIVKVYNKKAGVTYVYESRSYWDKEKQQPRNKRKLIGKIDPLTGEMVPTGKRGRRPGSVAIATEPCDASGSDGDQDYSALLTVIAEKEQENASLKERVRELEYACGRREETLKRLRSILNESMEP